jgi:hypothetical protein
MYYDRHGRPLAPQTSRQPAPAPAVAPAPSPAPHASADLLRAYLDAHRLVWHTDSLQVLHPEITGYLESRYAAARHDGTVRVRCLDGGYPDVVLDGGDLRPVVEALLSREYRQALFEEHISPAIERLAA